MSRSPAENTRSAEGANATAAVGKAMHRQGLPLSTTAGGLAGLIMAPRSRISRRSRARRSSRSSRVRRRHRLQRRFRKLRGIAAGPRHLQSRTRAGRPTQCTAPAALSKPGRRGLAHQPQASATLSHRGSAADIGRRGAPAPPNSCCGRIRPESANSSQCRR